MTDKEIRKRTKKWTKSSERAIRYGPFARASDLWCASRDAKKGIPAVPEGEAPDSPRVELSTPRMMVLGQMGLGRIEKEWIVFQAEVAHREAALRDSEARRKSLAAELDEAKDRLQQIEGATPDLTTKVAGEDRTPEAIVRQRRAGAQEATRERQQGVVRGLTARMESADAEIAHMREQIDIRLRVARRRAAMIEAYVRRRCATYLARLVRKHPNGARLNELMRPQWPDHADWAQARQGPESEGVPGLRLADVMGGQRS
jgi:hypothetical protein